MHGDGGEIATIVHADGTHIPVEGTIHETEEGMAIHFQDDGIEHDHITGVYVTKIQNISYSVCF